MRRNGSLLLAQSIGSDYSRTDFRYDPQTGRLIDTYEYLLQRGGDPPPVTANTTLAVVITDAQLTKEDANMVARMAQAGIARCTRPAHTQYDGDLVIALSTGERSADINVVGMVAARMVSAALLRAVELTNQP